MSNLCAQFFKFKLPKPAHGLVPFRLLLAQGILLSSNISVRISHLKAEKPFFLPDDSAINLNVAIKNMKTSPPPSPPRRCEKIGLGKGQWVSEIEKF
jgi:hypothetical protein